MNGSSRLFAVLEYYLEKFYITENIIKDRVPDMQRNLLSRVNHLEQWNIISSHTFSINYSLSNKINTFLCSIFITSVVALYIALLFE